MGASMQGAMLMGTKLTLHRKRASLRLSELRPKRLQDAIVAALSPVVAERTDREVVSSPMWVIVRWFLLSIEERNCKEVWQSCHTRLVNVSDGYHFAQFFRKCVKLFSVGFVCFGRCLLVR